MMPWGKLSRARNLSGFCGKSQQATRWLDERKSPRPNVSIDVSRAGPGWIDLIECPAQVQSLTGPELAREDLELKIPQDLYNYHQSSENYELNAPWPKYANEERNSWTREYKIIKMTKT